MISDAQEQIMAAKRAAKKQDKKNPHLINIENGRLMPNVPLIRKMKNYAIYSGPLDITSDADRLAWFSSNGRKGVRIVDTAAEAEETVDLGKMDKDELILFASDELGLMLDAAKDVATLRKEVMAYAQTNPSTSSAANADNEESLS